MGHDYIDLGTSHLRVNDSDIWTLRHFFYETASNSTPVSLDTDDETLEDLRLYLKSWEWLGPGIITGCDFNTFTTSRARLQLIQRMLSATRERMIKFGDSIPIDYLDEHINTPNAYYLDPQPVERFTDMIDRLLNLIPSDG